MQPSDSARLGDREIKTEVEAEKVVGINDGLTMVSSYQRDVNETWRKTPWGSPGRTWLGRVFTQSQADRRTRSLLVMVRPVGVRVVDAGRQK